MNTLSIFMENLMAKQTNKIKNRSTAHLKKSEITCPVCHSQAMSLRDKYIYALDDVGDLQKLPEDQVYFCLECRGTFLYSGNNDPVKTIRYIVTSKLPIKKYRRGNIYSWSGM